VTLKKELSLCEQYMNIEQLRLGSRLKVDWQVDKDLEDCLMPSLLLQPILENAIYHGVQPRSDGGTVSICVQPQGNQLHVMVKNPLPQQGEVVSKPGNRVAMDNIRNRLQAYYGEKARFTAEIRDENFITSIIYPAERAIPN
jgi:two-component system sensor histidine kinase AlgZ